MVHNFLHCRIYHDHGFLYDDISNFEEPGSLFLQDIIIKQEKPGSSSRAIRGRN